MQGWATVHVIQSHHTVTSVKKLFQAKQYRGYAVPFNI